MEAEIRNEIVIYLERWRLLTLPFQALLVLDSAISAPFISDNQPSDLWSVVGSFTGPLHLATLFMSGIDDGFNLGFSYWAGIGLAVFVSLFVIY